MVRNFPGPLRRVYPNLRESPLNFAEPVIERRKRKFQHHDGIVGTADLLEKSLQVLFEFRRLGPAEKPRTPGLSLGNRLGRQLAQQIAAI